QEEDAEYANKKGFSKHKPALPLYSVRDAVNAVKQLEPIDDNTWAEPASQLRFRFRTAGHIIGSGMIEAEILEEEKPLRCLFSGDVGRYDAPLVPDPHEPDPCDVLVVESTYGDRTHPEVSIQDQLKECLESIVERNGQMLVPAFAVGRSQQLVVLLDEVMKANPKLAVPIHLDSPMAVDTTKIYGKYAEESGLEEVDLRSGRSPIYGDNVYLHKKRDESMRLNDLRGPRVIISSSGMMTGGRVLHHLKRLVTDSRNLIVLAGYQAPGTRGWRLQRGEETVRIHGRDIDVGARLSKISGLSAHADSDQLVRWLKDLPAPKRTFIVHGDDGAPQALAKRFEKELGHHCETPELGDSYAL
ncbi:MAG: MBL fold metallo-hydrolase, partial [Planctomycetota bacterium]